MVYLDTTYCNKKHDFPKQSTILDIVSELAKRLQKESVADILTPKNSVRKFFKIISTKRTVNTLIVVGTYLIGKEKVIKSAAIAIGSQIYAEKEKRAIICNLEDPVLSTLLTDDPEVAGVHTISIGKIRKTVQHLLIRIWKIY